MLPINHKQTVGDISSINMCDKSSVNESELLLHIKTNNQQTSSFTSPFNIKNDQPENENSSVLLLLDRPCPSPKPARNKSNNQLVKKRQQSSMNVALNKNEKEFAKTIKEEVTSPTILINSAAVENKEKDIKQEDKNIKDYLKTYMKKFSKDLKGMEENLPFKEKMDGVATHPESDKKIVSFKNETIASSNKLNKLGKEVIKESDMETQKVGEFLEQLQRNVEEKKKKEGKMKRLKTSMGFDGLKEQRKNLTENMGSDKTKKNKVLMRMLNSNKNKTLHFDLQSSSILKSKYRHRNHSVGEDHRGSASSVEVARKYLPQNSQQLKKKESAVSSKSSNSKNSKLTPPQSYLSASNLLPEDNKQIIDLKICEIHNTITNENEGVGNESRALKSFQNVYDSFSEEEIEEEIENVYIQINNKSYFKKFWDIMIIILIIYSVTIVPYRLAFSTNEVSSFEYLDIAVDLIFLLDICFNFITPYYNDSEILVTNPLKIAWKYLLGWFFIDLISSMPTGIVSIIPLDASMTKSVFSNPYRPVKSLFSISRVSWFIKWLRILRLVKIARNDENSKVIADFQLNANSSINRILKFTILFSILTHISSCIWVFIGQGNYISWITKYMSDQPNFDTYICSIYFTLVTVFTIGYGDITAVNIDERVYNIFLLLFGVVLFSFTISALSTYFTNNIDFRKEAMMRKINILNEIYKENQSRIGRKLYEKIFKTIKHQFKGSNNEHYQLLETLPTYYRNHIVMLMHRKHIKDLNFFRNQSHDFILFVLPLLKPMKVTRGEVLFSVSEYVDEMYMVVRGLLTLHLDNYFDNIEVAQIAKNSHFGEILMYLNEQSPYILKCKSDFADLLVLRKNDITNIRISFSENILRILKESLYFLEEIDKRKRLITLFFKYETNESIIKKRIKQINSFLLKKGFDIYFSESQVMEEASDFILNNTDPNFFSMLFSSNFTESDLEKYYLKTVKFNSEVENNMYEQIEEVYEESESSQKDETKNINEKLNKFKSTERILTLKEEEEEKGKIVEINKSNMLISSGADDDKKEKRDKVDKNSYIKSLAQQILTESKNNLLSQDLFGKGNPNLNKSSKSSSVNNSPEIKKNTLANNNNNLRRRATMMIPELQFSESNKNQKQNTKKRRASMMPHLPNNLMSKLNLQNPYEENIYRNNNRNRRSVNHDNLNDPKIISAGNMNLNSLFTSSYNDIEKTILSYTKPLEKSEIWGESEKTSSSLKRYLEDIKQLEIKEENSSDGGEKTNEVKKKALKNKRPININVFQLDNTYNQKIYVSDKKNTAENNPQNVQNIYYQNYQCDCNKGPLKSNRQIKKSNLIKTDKLIVNPINNSFTNLEVLTNYNFTWGGEINKVNISPTFKVKKESSLEFKNVKFHTQITKVNAFSILPDGGTRPFNQINPARSTFIVSKSSSMSLKGLFSNLNDDNQKTTYSKKKIKGIADEKICEESDSSSSSFENSEGFKGKLFNRNKSEDLIKRRARRSTTAITSIRMPENDLNLAKRTSSIPKRVHKLSQQTPNNFRLSKIYNTKSTNCQRSTEYLLEDSSSNHTMTEHENGLSLFASPQRRSMNKSESIRKQFLHKINNGLKLNSYLATDTSSLLKSIQLFVGQSEEKTKLEYKNLKKLDRVLEILKVMKKKTSNFDLS